MVRRQKRRVQRHHPRMTTRLIPVRRRRRNMDKTSERLHYFFWFLYSEYRPCRLDWKNSDRILFFHIVGTCRRSRRLHMFRLRSSLYCDQMQRKSHLSTTTDGNFLYKIYIFNCESR
jgi:hypothetical protein